jgi:hypothetical protein
LFSFNQSQRFHSAVRPAGRLHRRR